MSDDAEMMEAFSAFLKQYKRKSQNPEEAAEGSAGALVGGSSSQLADDQDLSQVPTSDDVHTVEEYLSSSSEAKKTFHVSITKH